MQHSAKKWAYSQKPDSSGFVAAVLETPHKARGLKISGIDYDKVHMGVNPISHGVAARKSVDLLSFDVRIETSNLLLYKKVSYMVKQSRYW